MEGYKTLEVIGSGSYGTVYLVSDERNRKYALKKVEVNAFTAEDALKEIEVLKKIKHPNLINIKDYNYQEAQGKLEILTEYCQQGDLLSYMKKHNRKMSLHESMSIFQQITKAFIALNAKGIVHRDLKPDNVLLSSNKVIKIADFGCAKDNSFSKILTGSYDKGTLIYSSPQQLTNHPYTSKCDVWSAGCLLYFIYFGKHPFYGTTFYKVFNKIQQMTEDKEIQLEAGTDLRIEKILKLSLVYCDKERASWRELSLCRVFNKKIRNIENYLVYLWSISNIANWITGEFWKHRKEYNVEKNKSEMFAYFMIKFQYTNMKMAQQIINQAPKHLYLFESQAYNEFSKQLSIVEDILTELPKYTQYYLSIKKNMNKKKAQEIIDEKEPERMSCFSDLDNSIKICYKILQDVLPLLEEKKRTPGQKYLDSIWAIMGKWINFENWFCFEKKPKIQEIINEVVLSPSNCVKHELNKFERGIID